MLYETSLLDDSRALVPTPLLCGIDQEGGLVDRLREIFPPMPSARALRQHGDLAGVRILGRITGELLRMLGLNINFAPVMSIITQERSQLRAHLGTVLAVHQPTSKSCASMSIARMMMGAGTPATANSKPMEIPAPAEM